ncbi:MAG: 53EXOc protein [Patescibacteria group bacterium]|jgi:DNA polymerase-1|nr:53EXOc protein [Patescibacteria group bacterium]
MDESTRARFVIFDGHGLIYRAYHAFPPLSTKEGVLVNAVYGFSRILLTALNDLHPEYVAVAFDRKEKTKREEEYADYKAHRPSMPDDLKPQIGLVKEVVQALNIPQFELAGFEADDLIGTVTTKLSKESDIESIIVTGDKDMFQLVDDNVHVWMPARGKQAIEETEYDSDGVEQKMGVKPNQIVDLKALMGDSSDNIPGVRGVGTKTAQILIQTFGSLEGLYQRVAEIQETEGKDTVLKGALLQKLINGKEDAYLSQKLARIDRDAPIDFLLEPCKISSYDKEKVSKMFEDLEFRSLITLLPKDEFELGIQNALF